jgi:hypothetical protein
MRTVDSEAPLKPEASKFKPVRDVAPEIVKLAIVF